MPFKPKPVQPDFSSLITSLDNSRTQLTNYSLYQTIFFLIKNSAKARDLLLADVDTINELISQILAATILTVNDESLNFPNSRQLLAGSNVTFDDSVLHQRTINVILTALSTLDFLTHSDETAALPNSRQLLAGANIAFDDSVAGERTISSTGGGGSDHYDSPLSDGDLDDANLIFASGECIIVQVPI